MQGMAYLRISLPTRSVARNELVCSSMFPPLRAKKICASPMHDRTYAKAAHHFFRFTVIIIAKNIRSVKCIKCRIFAVSEPFSFGILRSLERTCRIFYNFFENSLLDFFAKKCYNGGVAKSYHGSALGCTYKTAGVMISACFSGHPLCK